jgi:uncharacterized protein (DUF2062 family)
MTSILFASITLLGQLNVDGQTISLNQLWPIVLVGMLVILALIIAVVFYSFGSVWFQAVMSGADVSMLSLIRMYFCHNHPTT